MTSCSGIVPNILTGGGPNVAANVQAGKTNTQTIGQTNNIAPTVSLRPNARVETVDQSNTETTNNELPPWLWVLGIVLFIVGWVTDTPNTMVRDLLSRRKKDAN